MIAMVTTDGVEQVELTEAAVAAMTPILPIKSEGIAVRKRLNFGLDFDCGARDGTAMAISAWSTAYCSQQVQHNGRAQPCTRARRRTLRRRKPGLQCQNQDRLTQSV
jgi:hypothetical protein